MLNSLMLAAVAVVALWILIMAIYLVVSRRQKDIAQELSEIDAQLESADPGPESS